MKTWCAKNIVKNRTLKFSITRIPGAVSLLCLPLLLCLIYAKQLNEQLYSIKVNTWNSKGDMVSECEAEKASHPARNYNDINLISDGKAESDLLKSGEVKIAQLIKTNDTIAGLHFSFGEHTRYWQFVKVLNVTLLYKASHYSIQEDSIWIWNASNSEKLIAEKQLQKEARHFFICGHRAPSTSKESSIGFLENFEIYGNEEVVILILFGLLCLAVLLKKKQL